MVFEHSLKKYKNKSKSVSGTNISPGFTATLRNSTMLCKELAGETLVRFGSTYVCEAAFSKMKYLKNEYRTRLLDGNLESELRLMIFSEISDFVQNCLLACKTKAVINCYDVP